MFGKLIGLTTLPIDLAKDAVTLGGTLTNSKSATLDKIDFLSGKKEFEREQDRKDFEAIIKAMKELEEKQ